MPRVISATEAKKRLRQVMSWVAEKGEEVVIQVYDRPKAVVVSYEACEEFRRLREEARRREALRRLEALALWMALAVWETYRLLQREYT
jgi:prevent-host-death family protein